MNARRLVTEDQLRERLRVAGKTDEEIEQWIMQYTETAYDEFPDEEAISRILQKTQEDSALRVRGFRLKREQYDALLSRFEESGKIVADQQIDASRLVKMALEEIINF